MIPIPPIVTNPSTLNIYTWWNLLIIGIFPIIIIYFFSIKKIKRQIKKTSSYKECIKALNKIDHLCHWGGGISKSKQLEHTCGSWPDPTWTKKDFKAKAIACEKCPVCNPKKNEIQK